MIKRLSLMLLSALTITGFASSSVLAQSSLQTQNTATHGAYAALGDSIAAGAGLAPSNNPTAEDAACGRSSKAYPHEVAAATQLPLVRIACGGAKASHFYSSQTVGSLEVMPQLKAAFASGKPRLITFTAGANDLDWSTFVGKCLTGTCGSQADQAAINSYMLGLRAKLHVIFWDTMRRSHFNPPEVIVTGYFNPVSPACSTLDPRLTADEVTWLSQGVRTLNQTLQEVSGYYGWFVKFAPVDFTGHDICSADSWIQRVGEPAPFHPTAKGQSEIAKSVLRAQ